MQSLSHNPATYLLKLQGDLNVLHPDKFNIIHTYYSKTDLKTQLVFRLRDVYNDLMVRSNPTLSENYNKLKSDFMYYIADRVKFLANPSSIIIQDLWGEAQAITQNVETKKQLQVAQMHIQDVVFASGKILEYQMQTLETVKQQQKKEVHDLLEKSLPTYKSLLASVYPDNDAKQLIEPVQKQLQELEKRLE